MNGLEPLPPDLDPPGAASLLANLGFIASSDLPDRPGPAYLLIAFRPEPTLHHYDPELVEYWVTAAGRGVPLVLTRDTKMPVDSDLSWGLIRIVDRLKASNEYLTFGGHLAAASIQGTTVAVFTSPTPLLRRGGQSQGWDHGAECVGAFFARLLVAVDYTPGFEARLAEASPLARYAAFVSDVVGRYRTSSALRSGHPELWTLLDADERRMQRDHPVEWSEGVALLHEAELEPSVSRPGI
jgi:hypothetical protein